MLQTRVTVVLDQRSFRTLSLALVADGFIGPAFSMIIGAIVGAFATMMGMKVSEFDPNVKVQELGTTDHKELAEAHVINAQAESIETVNEIKMMEVMLFMLV